MLASKVKDTELELLDKDLSSTFSNLGSLAIRYHNLANSSKSLHSPLKFIPVAPENANNEKEVLAVLDNMFCILSIM